MLGFLFGMTRKCQRVVFGLEFVGLRDDHKGQIGVHPVIYYDGCNVQWRHELQRAICHLGEQTTRLLLPVSHILKKIIFCSVCKAPSSQSSLPSHFWANLVLVCYLSLSWPALQTVQSSSMMNDMLPKDSFGKNQPSKLKLGSFNHTSYREYNATILVAISCIFL